MSPLVTGVRRGLAGRGPTRRGPFHATLRPSQLDIWGTSEGSAFPKGRARQGCSFQLGEDSP